MKPQIIITPCVRQDGTFSAIVAVSNQSSPVVVDVDNLGNFVTDILTLEDSKKPAK